MKACSFKMKSIITISLFIIIGSSFISCAQNKSDNKGEYGWFDRLDKISDRTYQASGWAILPDRKEPADAVFLAYENQKNEAILFKIVVQRTIRSDVAKSLGQTYLNVGWEGSFSLDDLPEGTTKISAWAYDTDTGKSFLLKVSEIGGRL